MNLEVVGENSNSNNNNNNNNKVSKRIILWQFSLVVSR